LLALLGRFGELGFDLIDQPAIARQTEQEVDRVVLAPDHQRLAGKARIGAQQETHRGPALADAGDDLRHLLDAAGAGVDICRAQFRDQ
jgi:hypothetical protein